VRRIVVLGDIVVDVIAVLSGPVAPGSDSPAQIRYAAGGAGANVAAWLAALDVPVSLVGRVGADDAGRRCVRELADAGVEVAVVVDTEATTGTVIALVDPDGERSMVPDRGANLLLCATDIDERLFGPGAHLHLSGYPLLDSGSRSAAVHVLGLARGAGMTISVDPASAAPLRVLGAERFLALTEGADLLLPNRAEAEVLTGHSDPMSAARRLGSRYAAVVVTCGADGAVWAAGGDMGRLPAEAARVVDTTGAGDAFAAGLLEAFVTERPLAACVAAGTRLAARAVGVIGAQPR